MNAIARAGWKPNCSLWEEPNTLMHKITAVLLYSTSGNPPARRFTMFRTDTHGFDEIHKQMHDEDCFCYQVGASCIIEQVRITLKGETVSLHCFCQD